MSCDIVSCSKCLVTPSTRGMREATMKLTVEVEVLLS